MRTYVMDAFTTERFTGNPAGIVLLEGESELSDELMQRLAAELRHSETAFVQKADGGFSIRYFTPTGEVPLCGHATIASFALLRTLELIADGRQRAFTAAGELAVDLENGTVFMDMAEPRILRSLTAGEKAELYAAFALEEGDCPHGLEPQVVSTGLSDIIMPVASRSALLRAVQDERAVTELSRRLDSIGVHMFALGDDDCTAYCSNFAPLVGINEECATGTANGALTWYLYRNSLVTPEKTNLFIQGEHMHRPSRILSLLTLKGGAAKVRIGGSAVMSMECRVIL